MIRKIITPVLIEPITKGFRDKKTNMELYVDMFGVYTQIMPGIWIMNQVIHKDSLKPPEKKD